MGPIGFSTGAVAKQNFLEALERLRQCGVRVVELSALRLPELPALVEALPKLRLADFEFVSFHAPSRFPEADESAVVRMLDRVIRQRIPIVVHPDVIYTPKLWLPFGEMLLIENMDKRKPIGRTARELEAVFDHFPASRFCFDLGHARQIDSTMIEAHFILERFSGRLAEVHISEVNTASRHEPLSHYAMMSFRSIAGLIPEEVPVILETLIDQGQSDIQTEIDRARAALEPAHDLASATR